MQLNLPNQLTLLRVLLIPIFLFVLMGDFLNMDFETARLAGVAIFIAASVTDALDGYIARKYNMVTNFGKFADPLADKLLVSAALITLVSFGDLDAWIVILIISRELTMTAFRSIAAAQNIVIAAGFLGKVKTVVQMVMIAVILAPYRSGLIATAIDLLVFACVVLTIVSLVEYLYKNRQVLHG